MLWNMLVLFLSVNSDWEVVRLGSTCNVYEKPAAECLLCWAGTGANRGEVRRCRQNMVIADIQNLTLFEYYTKTLFYR